MKKILLLTCLFGCSTAYAAAEQPLKVQYGAPSEKIYVHNNSDHLLHQYALRAGYAGWKVDSGNIGKLRFNGIELGVEYDIDRRGLWFKYENQDSNDSDISQISFGGQYTLYAKNKIYVLAQAGLGYFWADYKAYDNIEGEDLSLKIDAENIFLPVNLEVGYYFTPHFAAYAGLGYRWSDNQHAKACLGNSVTRSCDKSKISDLDLNGETYNFGVKYRF